MNIPDTVAEEKEHELKGDIADDGNNDNDVVIDVIEPSNTENKELTVEDAEKIIEKSKEPFWGELIKQLYHMGFTIDQMRDAFRFAHQEFKWSGQICIWFQDSKPTCIEQLKFANGNGSPDYVKEVIQRLVEENCKEITPPPQDEMKQDELQTPNIIDEKAEIKSAVQNHILKSSNV